MVRSSCGKLLVVNVAGRVERDAPVVVIVWQWWFVQHDPIKRLAIGRPGRAGLVGSRQTTHAVSAWSVIL